MLYDIYFNYFPKTYLYYNLYNKTRYEDSVSGWGIGGIMNFIILENIITPYVGCGVEVNLLSSGDSIFNFISLGCFNAGFLVRFTKYFSLDIKGKYLMGFGPAPDLENASMCCYSISVLINEKLFFK